MGTKVGQWPPEIRQRENTPRLRRGWKISRDGSFWGGILLVLIAGSIICYVLALLLELRQGP